MNQYEKEIQALKYRCRKLEQQCSMFNDTFQKQNQLVKSQDDMIQILKERNHYLEEHIATLTKAYRVQEECEKRCREMEREVRKLKTELENAVRQLRQNREHWFQVYGDMEKEHKKVVERKQGEIRRLQKLCKKTAIAYEQMHEKYLEQLHLKYAAESALEEEKGKTRN